MVIFCAVISGFTLRGAIQAAADGNAWMALLLGVLAVVNLGCALAKKAMDR